MKITDPEGLMFLSSFQQGGHFEEAVGWSKAFVFVSEEHYVYVVDWAWESKHGTVHGKTRRAKKKAKQHEQGSTYTDWGTADTPYWVTSSWVMADLLSNPPAKNPWVLLEGEWRQYFSTLSEQPGDAGHMLRPMRIVAVPPHAPVGQQKKSRWCSLREWVFDRWNTLRMWFLDRKRPIAECWVESVRAGDTAVCQANIDGLLLPIEVPFRTLRKKGIGVGHHFRWRVPPDGRMHARDIVPLADVPPTLTAEQSKRIDSLHEELRDFTTERFLDLFKD